MKARLVLLASKEDACWKSLVDKFIERYNVDDVIKLARRRYFEVLRDEIEEVEGDVADERDNLILTWEDGIVEVVRIYEKL